METTWERRPRRSVLKRDYREFADVKVPKRTKVLKTREIESPDDKLYRLQVVEKDAVNELVKVRYIGYDSNYDEWRPASDIIDLTEDDPIQEDSISLGSKSIGDRCDLIRQMPPINQYSLYEELLFRIKSLLTSSRKGDPMCCVSMGFDTIHFDGLVMRSVLADRKSQNSKRHIYTLSTLTKLDDILGSRWYIRGINAAGDFCFVEPKTVRYQLLFSSGKADYQLLEDGTLKQFVYGARHQLIFRFVRGDGISSQWNNILKLCKT